VDVPVEILELAENANTYTPLGPTDERIVDDRYVLWMGRGDAPGWNVAQRFRLRGDEVEQVVDEVRGIIRARGRTALTWEVGSSATPPDLVERLLALGMVDDRDPLAIGMVLTDPPAHAPPDVEVRRAESPDELREASRIAAIGFGMNPDDVGVEDPEPRIPGIETYLAYADGRPVARATAAFSEHGVTLFGGATLPEARGRGAYRALVAARWDDAVAAGKPALVTQAGEMSRPILQRLGFREVCEIRILLDELSPPPSAAS
jgi:GNAT superfamily N-acetyltransferase